MIVNGPGDHFLARSALTHDEYAGVAGRGERDFFAYLEHGVALADQVAQGRRNLGFRLQGGDLRRQPPMLQCPGDRMVQLVSLERFVNIVAGALLDCLDCQLQVVHTGHHDDRRIGILLPNRIQQVQPGAIRELVIQEYEIRGRAVELLHGFLAAACGGYGIALVLEVHGEHLVETGIVIDDEHTCSHGIGYSEL